MTDRPDNVLQFRHETLSASEHHKIRQYYFGGCGPDQDFWPERHSWGKWERFVIAATGIPYRTRTCRTCCLVSDMDFEGIDP